jgi:hypothetical protein
MKARLTLIVFFLICSFSGYSQDWQPVKTNGEYYFKNLSGEIHAIRIDSVKWVGNNQLFYNFQTIRATDGSSFCYTAYGASWIGPYVGSDNNGLCFFLNNSKDTIWLKSSALLNETWHCYSFPDGRQISASISAMGNSSFLGLDDSVKTITLQVTDANGNPLNHFLNNYTLKLSKHYGLTRLLNFNMFPDSVSLSWQYPEYEHQAQYDIVGMTSPQVGMTNLSLQDAFDYQPGDEFHTKKTDFSWSPPGLIDTIYTIRKVLQRLDLPLTNSLSYLIERIQMKIIYGTPSSQIVRTRDTIDEIIDFGEYPAMDLMRIPGEVVRSFYMPSLVFVLTMGEYCNGRRMKTIPNAYNQFNSLSISDTCMTPFIIDFCAMEQSYIEGCGGPYGQCQGMIDSHSHSLLYYKKGTEECGNPLDPGVLLAIDDPVSNNPIQFRIVPNPAKDACTIELSGGAILPCSLEINSLIGKTMLKEAINMQNTQILIPALPPGIYIVRLTNGQGMTISQKLIVQ